MKALRAWAVRLSGLFSKRRREQEMAEEFESHLALQVADNIRAGMTPEQARRDAVQKLGGLEAAKEAYREQNTAPILEHLWLDLRFTVRQLRKTPAFTTAAVLVLALGMCASISIFAFVDAALVRPLPYPDPSRLVAVTETAAGLRLANLSDADYRDWKRFNTVLQSLDVYRHSGFLISTPSGSVPVRGARVSYGFFQTLGVVPLMGRSFSAADETPHGPESVILSYGTWKTRFGGEDVLGRRVTLSRQAYTVIGVLPKDFNFAPLGAAEIWSTIDTSGDCAKRRTCHNLTGIGRLCPGVSIESALANLTAVAKRLEEQYPESNRGRGASVILLSRSVTGSFRSILILLMAAAGLLLVIACVNVASLVLVRTEGRRREVALRTALGASFTRHLNQFVTESFVLVLTASALGSVTATWVINVLKSLIPLEMHPGMPFLLHLGFSPRVAAYSVAIAALSVALFSLVPLLHLSRSHLREGLNEGSRGSAGAAWGRLGSRMVVAELAIAMVLLVGAALFGKSLYRLLNVELGFRADRLATIDISFPDVGYEKEEQRVTLAREVIQRIESLPGVESAAIASVPPVSYNGDTDWIRFVGKPYDGKHIEVNERDVSSEYFRTIGAKLVRGRFFDDTDDLTRPRVVIVNQRLANRYFPGEDPIGRQMGDTSLSPKSIKTIVGVVEDIREGSLDSEIWPAEYHPYSQDPNSSFTLVARTSHKAEGLLAELGPAVHEVRADVGTRKESTMSGRIDNSMSAYLHRSSAWLVGGFAAAALLLVVVGLYGVVAYSVSQRTREIGVRMALGAASGSVYRMILKEAGWLAAMGIAIGLVGSIGAATLARKLLFGVSSWDLQILIAAPAILSTAALVASFIPARRAALVNPIEALRTE